MRTALMAEEPDGSALAEDIAYVRAVFDGLTDSWVRFGRPLPPAVVRARAILERTLTCVMSLERQDFGSDEEDFSSENIGSAEAAKMLGVTRRTVQRNAESLGGQQVSGSWVFPRDEIGADHCG
jgi:hypothetical protein